MEKREEIQEFIRMTIEDAIGTDRFDDETELLAEGFLNSMSILFVVSEVEERFDIRIPIVDINEKTFRSVAQLVDYVERHLNEGE